MLERVCVIGLDEPEVAEIQERIEMRVVAFEQMPRIIVRGGELRVEPKRGPEWLSVTRVVFHSIYENDMDFLAGLALWDGPCLPDANAMLNCRLKFPCLVRALQHTRFGATLRGYVSPDTPFTIEGESVAKWGNWHCGENKIRFSGFWQSENACIIEKFLPGQAVRVIIIGEQFWQIKLEGPDWLKSIHDSSADFMEIDSELLDDTRNLKQAFGLDIIANDYIVSETGSKHLLEVNHIPNVTRFPEIGQAYRDFTVSWLQEMME